MTGGVCVAAMGARVPAVDAVMRLQAVQEGKPFAMVGCPAVQHHQRRAIAADFEVDGFAVVSNEFAHGRQV